jgi:hypothetical protein
VNAAVCIVALVVALVVTACSTSSSTAIIPPAASPAVVSDIYVYKSPTCTCCHEWEEYLEQSGFSVHSIPTVDMSRIKDQMGVPESAWSCHTAVVDGYVVEGHVPVAAILDLMSGRPDIDGIALPGMPAGSPGMPGAKAGPFEVLALQDGLTSEFGAY